MRLEPDVLVVMDGRNDAFPQLFSNYQDDHSHYRHLSHDFRSSNYWYKQLFRISHVAMLMRVGGEGHLGFNGIAEHPFYASIRYENRPSINEMRENAANNRQSEGFRRNLQWIIESARARGIEIVLATIPYRLDGYVSGVIPRDAKTLPFVTAMVRRNQEITREVAKSSNVVVVDAAARFSSGEYLVDDCHFNVAGERAFATLLSAAIWPILENRVSAREAPLG
jgi:lysophospholipase L1-like esterase